MNGPTGLDYATLPHVFEMMGITLDKRGDVFANIRIMEGEALSVMSNWKGK